MLALLDARAGPLAGLPATPVVQDAPLTPTGAVEVLADGRVNLDNELFEDWRVSRDRSGDGVPEELRFSDRNTRVYRGEALQAFTIYRCCGY